MYLVNHEKLAH